MWSKKGYYLFRNVVLLSGLTILQNNFLCPKATRMVRDAG